MELLNYEQRAKSYRGFVAIIAYFVLGGVGVSMCFVLVFSFGLKWWLIWLVMIFFGVGVAFALFMCINCIDAFAKDEVWRFGIRDDVIWWESPRLPRSAGFIPLRDVCKMTVHADANELEVTLRDGTTRRIPWKYAAARDIEAILSEHYPNVTIKFKIG